MFEEFKALQLYLLCTCIDALSSNDNYIPFPNWLRIDTKNKDKYKINDKEISDILYGVSNLSDPNIFRHTASRLHDEIYTKNFGDWKSFLREFKLLPIAMKKFLADVYFIAGYFDSDPTLPTFNNSKIEYSIWDAAHKDWEALPIELDNNISDKDSKIHRIADYYYKDRRNPYTHKALSKRVLEESSTPRNLTGNPFLQYISTNDVLFRDNKYKIVAFRAGEGEDEVLILRLVVMVAWLRKLNYTIDEKHIEDLRWYQLRRENGWNAMNEVEDIQKLWQYYDNVLADNSRDQYLPPFPTNALKSIRPYLYKSTPNEENVDQLIGEWISDLDYLNGFINDYNNSDNNIRHKQPDDKSRDIEEVENLQRQKSELCLKIKGKREFFYKTRGLYFRLNDMVYRTWWPK